MTRSTPLAWRCYLGAFGVSNTYDGILLTVMPLLAAQITTSPFRVSLVVMAERLPWLLLSIAVGRRVDALGAFCMTLQGATLRAVGTVLLFGLFVTSQLGLWWLICVALILGISEVMIDTASDALVPLLLPREEYWRANRGLRTLEITTNDFVGRGLAALLALVSMGATLVATCVGAACALVGFRLASAVRPPYENSTPSAEARPAAARFALPQSPGLRFLLVSNAFVVLAFSSTLGTQVLFAKQGIGTNDLGFGVLLIVPTIGALIARFLPESWVSKIAVTLRIPTLYVILGALLCSIWWSGSSLFGVAVTYIVVTLTTVLINVDVSTVRQSLTHAGEQGATAGVFRTVTWGMSSLGMLGGGALAEWGLRHFSAPTVYEGQYVLSGAVLASIGATWFVLRPWLATHLTAGPNQ